MVDDVPEQSQVKRDMKFFESNFKGVMPLEIIVDTKEKRGVSRNFNNLVKIDSLSQFLAAMPGIARPVRIIVSSPIEKRIVKK